MAKYRKRPVVIEAEQYGGPGAPLVDGMVTDFESGKPFCPTDEGPLWVSEGDWIITGVKGERYPCKPDVFAQTYEPAE